MKQTISTILFSTCFALPALASDLQYTDPWVRASSGNMKHTAAYVVIKNDSAMDRRLIGAKIISPSDLKGMVSIHETLEKDGVYSMQALKSGLSIPAGESRVLKPKSTHIMLMNLNQKLKAGSEITLSLEYANKTNSKLQFTVR